jgi:hypothetical protein
MDVLARRLHHARVRVLPHVKKLDDCLGDFVVRVTCPRGTSRHIEPEALARIAGMACMDAPQGVGRRMPPRGFSV